MSAPTIPLARWADEAATLRLAARYAARAATGQVQRTRDVVAWLRSKGCDLVELESLDQLATNAQALLGELAQDAERLRARLVLEYMDLPSLDAGHRRAALKRVVVGARSWDAALQEVAHDRRDDAVHALELEDASRLVGDAGVMVVLAVGLLWQAGLGAADVYDLVERWEARRGRSERGAHDPLQELQDLRLTAA
jgi:hypothetical protein